MTRDHIIEKIHTMREDHARRHNFDVRAIYEDWKKQEKQNKRTFVTRSIQRKKRTTKRTIA